MHLALIKTSSLGDVVHALPALTEAAAALPGLRCDWVVEEAYAPIPSWHPAVDAVLPVALRRWRRRPRAAEIGRALAALRVRRYDLVLDAQGLLKSAALARVARGPRAGFDRRSAREGLASVAYSRRIPVPRTGHAVERLRALFAGALGYVPADQPPAYGLDLARLEPIPARAALVFLHGTTWPSKRYPVPLWQALAQRAAAAGLEVLLPWGDAAERQTAQAIAAATPAAQVLPALPLPELARVLAGARAVVGVDTGLVHLAAALGRPTVALYGATDPARTGTWGPGQVHRAAAFPCAPCLARRCVRPDAAGEPPCYATVAPEQVWAALAPRLAA